VDLTTSVLPSGWRDRLVKVQNVNTAAPGTDREFTGWCLDREDLCVAKLCAHRDKDMNFVAALLDADLVAADTIEARLSTVAPEHEAAVDAATKWVESWRASRPGGV
jgi:hypothetical protein